MLLTLDQAAALREKDAEIARVQRQMRESDCKWFSKLQAADELWKAAEREKMHALRLAGNWKERADAAIDAARGERHE